MKNKFLMSLYWIWEILWGFLLTIPGILILTFCKIFLKCNISKNGYGIIIEIGGNWGGVNFGPVSLCGSYNQKSSTCYSPEWFQHTRRHEFGHSVQQLILGPLQPFLVAIPSVIRYWVRRIREKHNKSNPPYDQIIFEYTASKYGYKAINWIDNENLEYTFKRK